MLNYSPARHSFSGCSCGHVEHVGSPEWSNARSWHVRCPECDDIEQREGVIIATDTVARVGALAIGEGTVVRCKGQSCRVVSIVEILRLGGRYSTGYVRLKLRELAA